MSDSSSASVSAASSDADDDSHERPGASFVSDSDDDDDDDQQHDAAGPDFSASSLRLHLLTSARALPSRAALLRSIGELAPSWQPYKMSAAERQAWYRIGGDNHDATCRTSKDWMMVGRKYENKKKFEAAAQAFCRAVRLNPHCASYYFRLGCVQCELTDWGAAIESFHIAIQLAPETAKATYYFNLGYAHSEQRGWAEAIEALKRAIQIKPRKHFYHNLIVRGNNQQQIRREERVGWMVKHIARVSLHAVHLLLLCACRPFVIATRPNTSWRSVTTDTRSHWTSSSRRTVATSPMSTCS